MYHGVPELVSNGASSMFPWWWYQYSDSIRGWQWMKICLKDAINLTQTLFDGRAQFGGGS